MNSKASLLLAAVFIFISCNQEPKKETEITTQPGNFITAPIPGVDIPYKEYSVDALKGDTFFYQTGSILLFPPNAFVDKDGNIIKGNVQVKYREFSNPIDFYLSGIPMEYDSLGTKYVFESSGMCEVLAFQHGKPVFVNPKNKPEINIVSNNNSPSHHLYYLDSVKKQWVNKGISTITQLNKPKKENGTNPAFISNELVEPMKPGKADENRPVIKIVIDPASFGELSGYDNLEFQLDANEKNFNPEDSSYEWNNVELQKGKRKGLYTLRFSNAEKTVIYAVKPVLKEEDYDKAIKVFEKNNAEYKRKISERLNNEKASREKYAKDSLQYKRRMDERSDKEKVQREIHISDSLEDNRILEENKRIEKLNILIEARNKQIKKLNEIVTKQNKINQGIDLSNKTIRSFQIDGFGIWNCDKLNSTNSFQITATFKDEKGNMLDLRNIAILCKSFNGIRRYVDNKILLVKDDENMIIGTYEGRFAFITFEDYNKLNLTTETKEQTFIMTVVSEENNNYDFIKKVAGR